MEKSHQARKMYTILAMADKVVMWFGEGDVFLGEDDATEPRRDSVAAFPMEWSSVGRNEACLERSNINKS